MQPREPGRLHVKLAALSQAWFALSHPSEHTSRPQHGVLLPPPSLPRFVGLLRAASSVVSAGGSELQGRGQQRHVQLQPWQL